MASQNAAERPPPRLMISKMVLENFKSYAGVRSIGPFHKCFSSVVGPNGSGKSNVIDAMLFVFGKRAKKLRLNKVSELIHSSTDFQKGSDKELKFAQVTVYFHEIIDTGSGDEDYDVVEGSECVVSRMANIDNSSSYHLNGKKATFKTVADYLGDKGIDLDNNRFLILQGEVEMISMMAPKGKTENDEGLLEYLEDIIGSNKYVADADAQMKVVETLTEQRQEKLNRVKAVEKEKEALEGAKVEAEAFMGKEKELRKKKNIVFQMNAMEVDDETQVVRNKNDQVKSRLESEREKLKESEARVAEIEAGYDAQTAEYDSLHAELKATKDEFAAFERRDIKLREDIKHGKANIKKLEDKIKNEDEKVAENQDKSDKAEKSIPKLEKKITTLSADKVEEDAKLEAIYESLKGVTAELRAQLEVKTAELAPIKEERATFQNDLDTATTEVKLLTDATTRSQEQLEKAEKELSSVDAKQSKLRATLSETEDELATAQARLPVAKKELSALVKKESELQKQHAEFTARAEESLASASQNTSRSAAVEGILKAAKKGGELSKAGILGRLGDLATIDDKYDVAISTACGTLDNIVVETAEGAQKCLTFLRKYGLGRANFLPLDKVTKNINNRHKAEVETPDGADRLFDLIKADEALKPALFLALHNTIVAPNLDMATKWAYLPQRWRVVTMDGQLIDKSGTMAGGGKSVRRGKMMLSSQKGKKFANSMDIDEADDSSELSARAGKALQELKKNRIQQAELTEEIRSLEKTINKLTVALSKLPMEISGCDTTREALSNSIPELRKAATLSPEDKKKLAELQKNVSACKSAMSSIAMKASKIEGEVNKLQRSILDAGGPKLKTQQKACETVLNNLNKANTDLNTAKVTIKTCANNVTKANEAKISATESVSSANKAVETDTAALKSLEDEAFVVMQAFEKAKGAAEEKKLQLDAVTKEFETLKKASSKIKSSEVDILAQLDAFENQIKEGENRLKFWAEEVDKLHEGEKTDEAFDVSDDEGEEDGEGEKKEEEGENDNEKDKMEVDSDEVKADDADDKSKTKYSNTHSKTLPAFARNALSQFDRSELKFEINTLEKERDSLAKDANMGAIAEYRKKERDYLSRVTELDKVTEERNEARKSWDELRRLRLEKFMDGFGQITLKLKEMYQMITLGGDAELELVDSLDPFSEGIVFSVRPPKKSWKNIANLSGGEKTLSSLALVFALHHFKPTPLYVMDEIDAALDFKNVSIVANYIKERTKNAQFIIISLRNNMFELADRLVGIYKTNNCTKSVTINPKAFGKAGREATKKGGEAVVMGDRTNIANNTNAQVEA